MILILKFKNMLRRNLYSIIFISSSLSFLMAQDQSHYPHHNPNFSHSIRHDPYSRTLSDYVFSLYRAEQNIEQLFQIVQRQELNHQRSSVSFESLLAEKAEPFLNKVLTTTLVEMKKDFLQHLEETKRTCSYNDQPLLEKILSLTLDRDRTQESLMDLKNQLEVMKEVCQKMLMVKKNETGQLNEMKSSIRHLKGVEVDQKKSMLALQQENTQLHLKIKKLSERLTNQETLFEKRLSVLAQKIEHQTLEIKELKEQSKCKVALYDRVIMEERTKDLPSKIENPPQDQEITKIPIVAFKNPTFQYLQPPRAPETLTDTPSTTPESAVNSRTPNQSDNPLLNNLIAHPLVAKMLKIQNVRPEEYQEFQKILLRNITQYCVSFSLDPNINHQHFIDAITYLCRIDCTYLKSSFYEFLLKAYLKNSPELQNNLLLILKKALTKRSEIFSKKHETLALSLIETIDILEEQRIENLLFINTLDNIEDIEFFKNHFSELLALCKSNKVSHTKCRYLEHLNFYFSLKKYLILYRQNDSQNDKNIIQSLERLIFYMSVENTENTIAAILNKRSTLDETDKEALEVIFKNFERLYISKNKMEFFNNHPLVLNKVTENPERKKWFIFNIMDKAYNGLTGYSKFRKRCLSS